MGYSRQSERMLLVHSVRARRIGGSLLLLDRLRSAKHAASLDVHDWMLSDHSSAPCSILSHPQHVRDRCVSNASISSTQTMHCIVTLFAKLSLESVKHTCVSTGEMLAACSIHYTRCGIDRSECIPPRGAILSGVARFRKDRNTICSTCRVALGLLAPNAQEDVTWTSLCAACYARWPVHFSASMSSCYGTQQHVPP
ncbi:hypothetical protein CBOM_08029 [Ceraceosorus bombacis]|uniref:Uncharacterized protein n=1 Tax=Ceraceosorus bombacis TaxID=401625 RepID=A0A0P1BTG0_9BASI|nr:hypothetical protein CBOM_08029 [Ceraceosorus bombacis]